MVCWLLGMFALMRIDYRRLREPLLCTQQCYRLLMRVGAFFLEKSHARTRGIRFVLGSAS